VDDGGIEPSGRTPHRPSSTVLATTTALGAVVGLVLVFTGIALLVAARSEPSAPEERSPDGWGAVLSPVLTSGGVVITAVAAQLLVSTLRGRRWADEGDPRPLRSTAITSLVLGIMAIPITLPGIVFGPLALAPVLAIVHVVGAATTVHATRTSTRGRAGSGPAPGGLPLPQEPPRD